MSYFKRIELKTFICGLWLNHYGHEAVLDLCDEIHQVFLEFFHKSVCFHVHVL